MPPSRSSVSKTSLVDTATEQIRNKILDLSLPPGQAINSAWLVDHLKLSRTPIREALNRLAAEGLIRLEANQGVFVHPLDVNEITQLMEAYGIAERVSAHFCEFDDTGLLKDVVDMQARQRQAMAAHQYLDASNWNARFRGRIAESSDNHHLIEFCRRMINHTRRLSCFIYKMEARDPDYYAAQNRMLEGLHHDIEDAIARRNRARLVGVLTEQVDVFRERIAWIFRSDRDIGFTVAAPVSGTADTAAKEG